MPSTLWIPYLPAQPELEWEHCERRSLINKDAIQLGSLRYIKGTQSPPFLLPAALGYPERRSNIK